MLTNLGARKKRDALLIILVGALFGLLYPLLDREVDDTGALINGLVIGLLGSLFLVYNEIISIKPRIRRMRFTQMVAYKSLKYSTFYALIILIVISITRSIEMGEGFFNYLRSDAFSNFIWNEDFHIIVIYALVSTTVFIFTYQMSRKMGQGVLLNFISGKYRKPREEDRIFMFMDLNDSTSLAEDLGDIKYNKLLNDCFFDFTDSILANYGKIYRYVADEVVVSWKVEKGLAKANCLKTYFQAVNTLYVNREKYYNLYGMFPVFSAGFHYGKVVVGEIGEVKSQISFIGDVMYETGQIEKECKRFKSLVLISDELLDKIDLPDFLTSERVGSIDITGLSAINVSSVSEKNQANVKV